MAAQVPDFLSLISIYIGQLTVLAENLNNEQPFYPKVKFEDKSEFFQISKACEMRNKAIKEQIRILNAENIQAIKWVRGEATPTKQELEKMAERINLLYDNYPDLFKRN